MLLMLPNGLTHYSLRNHRKKNRVEKGKAQKLCVHMAMGKLLETDLLCEHLWELACIFLFFQILLREGTLNLFFEFNYYILTYMLIESVF